VRALYVSGVNIAVTYPDTERTLAALKALDFLVAAVDTMTPVAQVADVVLPKTIGLEEEHVQLQPRGPCLNYTAPVLPPAGEARNDTEIAVGIVAELRRRGLIERDLMPWRSHEEFLALQLEGTSITIEELRERGFVAIPYEYRDYERTGFRTPTGLLELYATRLERHGLAPLPTWEEADARPTGPDYPLSLLTGVRSIVYHHSRFRDHAWARRMEPDPTVHLHPETARTLGLAHDEWAQVTVKDGCGSFKARVKHDDRISRGVASTGMGWWLHGKGIAPDLSVNVNAAVPYGPPWDPAVGCPDTHGLPCRLAPIAAE
jgi:anaerobic selenocysteine-containing dehydrogenase